MKQKTKVTTPSGSEKRPFWVLTREEGCDILHPSIIEAHDEEEALREAIAVRNRENGCGPNEDCGYLRVEAYDRDDLLAMLKMLKTRRPDNAA